MNQDDVAAILGLQGYHVSNIEKGRRALADSEKRLLDWYFFGILPPKIITSASDLRGVLEFDEAEWKAVSLMAARDGKKSPGEWIASRIRDYIALAGGSQSQFWPTGRHIRPVPDIDPALKSRLNEDSGEEGGKTAKTS